MKLTFLGTSAMIPTKDRNTSAAVLKYENELILIDCGEGTQRQMRLAKISPTKITKILITHWHGDHVLGLPGLLQTLSAQEYNKELEIYGPKRTKKNIKQILKIFPTNIKIKIKEIKKTQEFLNEEKYLINSIKLDHNCPAIGYSFIEKDKINLDKKKLKKLELKNISLLKKLKEGKTIKFKNKKITTKNIAKITKGKKISILGDTRYSKEFANLIKKSDILVCESTFRKDLKNKAKQYYHLTNEDAARIAKQGKVKQLILTHFGQRYKHTSELIKETKKIFPKTLAAKDFLEIEI